MAKQLKIDIHTHILPKEMPAFKKMFGYGGFIELQQVSPCCAKMVKDDGTFFREVKNNCWDSEVRLAEADSHGIDVQVLSTVPVMFSYWAKKKDALTIAQFLNDDLADTVQKAPKRFVGLGTLPLQCPDAAIKEIERGMGELGFAGFQIGSHVNHWNLDEACLFPVFEAAERLGAALFIHPWEMMGAKETPKFWLPWLVGMPAETTRAICSMIFGGVFERLPKLRVAFAHGGGAFAFILGRITHGFACKPDICAKENNVNPKQYVGRFFVDTLVHDRASLDFLIKQMGVENIALGSDYPFPLGETIPGALIQAMSHLKEDDKAMLYAGSALRFLNKKAEDFIVT